MNARAARTADPYRDTDVIDARAPRFNQAFVGLLAALALVTGWWPIYGLLALHLGVGLTFGRRFCITCLAYFELIQPRFGEGSLEDSRPPRFANKIGVAVLSAATVAYVANLPVLGAVLGGLVASLALAAALTGLCVGCEVYRIGARLRAITTKQLDRVDLADFGSVPAGDFVLQFTHPLCTDCHSLLARLRAEGRPVVSVDVRERPELARKYGVGVVPTAVEVTHGGIVAARLAG